MFITVTHYTTSKESACTCMLGQGQQTSQECWFANVNKKSYRDLTNSLYPVTITTIRTAQY